MIGLIFAAGVGNRLKTLHKGPKCLMMFGGRTLLERQLRVLKAVGVSEAVVVTGYENEKVAHALSLMSDIPRVKTVFNPDYERGSILSFMSSLDSINGQDVFTMDADVLCEKKVMEEMVASLAPNCMPFDRSSVLTGEEFMVGARGDRISRIARGLKGEFDHYGEWVGFIKMSAATLDEYARIAYESVKAGQVDIGYEDILDTLVARQEFACTDISGLNWVEIDFPEDVKKAEEMSRTIAL